MRTGCQISCLTTGWVRPKRARRGLRRHFPGGWSEERLPINAFLIDHPLGFGLFDTGQSALASLSGYLPGWHPFLRLARFELEPGDEAVAQLRRMGVEAAAIRWIVLSHLHTDHVGGLAAFPHAEVMVSPREWARAAGHLGRMRGYLPQHWPAGLEPRLIEFSDPPVGPFPASLDIAGDGRLVLIPAPGHTPGHVALLVRADAGLYLCGGDLAHSADALATVAPELAEYCRAEGIVFLAAHDSRARELVP